MKAKSFASRDEQEVAGYADAMEMIFESFESITPTEDHQAVARRPPQIQQQGSESSRPLQEVTNHVEGVARSCVSAPVKKGASLAGLGRSQ